jgi:alkylated DNA repair dioxygenase AlkB
VEGLISLVDGECYLVDHFLDKTQADFCFENINQNSRWHQPRVNLFGKQVASPRLAAWYGDPEALYTYSGMVNEPLPWFESLSQLRLQVEDYTGIRFNSVLINLYRNGNDAMGWHSDNESELGSRPAIASVSLGATRRFLMRHKRRKDASTLKVELHHGSLLVMKGETQQHWRHAVPRTRQAVKARINLTFRFVHSR